MNNNNGTLIRVDIVNEARKYLGVRFLHHGRSHRGLDCAGLLYVVYNKIVGLNSDFLNYPLQMKSAFVFRKIREYATRINNEIDAGPGDVVLMNFNGLSSHLGIKTIDGLIFSSCLLKRVVEHTIYKRHILGGGRVVAYFRIEGVPSWRT